MDENEMTDRERLMSDIGLGPWTKSNATFVAIGLVLIISAVVALLRHI